VPVQLTQPNYVVAPQALVRQDLQYFLGAIIIKILNKKGLKMKKILSMLHQYQLHINVTCKENQHEDHHDS
jgi:hypothetical protein